MTALGKVHTHLFLLGMIVFLIIALYSEKHDLEKQKTFRVFMWVYNIGVPLTSVMLQSAEYFRSGQQRSRQPQMPPFRELQV